MDERQIDPGHKSIQRVLLIGGPILAGMGLILTVIGIASFAMAFGGSEPRYFWCALIGLPILFGGGAMTSFGLLGKVVRYQAQEMAPVAKDTFNYMAEGTRESVKTVAGAIGEGLHEAGLGGGSQTMVRCHKCNALNGTDAKFCSQCGQAIGQTKPCPQCREMNDPDHGGSNGL